MPKLLGKNSWLEHLFWQEGQVEEVKENFHPKQSDCFSECLAVSLVMGAWCYRLDITLSTIACHEIIRKG